MQTNHSISARTSDQVLINKKKITCHLVYFSVLALQRVKIKETETIQNYLDLARELEKLWNMSVAVINVVFDALRTKDYWKNRDHTDNQPE